MHNSGPPNEIDWFSFVLVLLIIIVLLWNSIPIQINAAIFNTLNSIYYPVSLLLEQRMSGSEKILVTLEVTSVKPNRFSEYRGKSVGLLVLTTHKGILVAAPGKYYSQLDQLIGKPHYFAIETFDFSSPIHLLKTYDGWIFPSLFKCKRFMIKTDNSDESEKWDVTPTDGNNFALFEAILEKRDRIK
jgi:hypothetical protein